MHSGFGPGHWRKKQRVKGLFQGAVGQEDPGKIKRNELLLATKASSNFCAIFYKNSEKG